MSTVERRYLKDENGEIFSPIVSIESIYSGTSGGGEDKSY